LGGSPDNQPPSADTQKLEQQGSRTLEQCQRIEEVANMDRGNITPSYFRPLRTLQKGDPRQTGFQAGSGLETG
jgi:hypothetical protein